MTATINHLLAEYEELKTLRDAINIPNLLAVHVAAQQALAGYRPPHGHSVDIEEGQLSSAVSAAYNALSGAKSEVAGYDRRMAPLAQMLSAADRLAATGSDLVVHAERVAAAAARASDAGTTVTTLAGMLADATANHELESAGAAKALMDAAKGGKAAKFVVPDRAQVATTEQALAMAQNELDEAALAHTAAIAAHTEALRLNDLARADVSTLGLELATRDYAALVVKHRAIVGTDFDPTDLLLQRVWRLEDDPK